MKKSSTSTLSAAEALGAMANASAIESIIFANWLLLVDHRQQTKHNEGQDDNEKKLGVLTGISQYLLLEEGNN